jgi:hypothetical protein
MTTKLEKEEAKEEAKAEFDKAKLWSSIRFAGILIACLILGGGSVATTLELFERYLPPLPSWEETEEITTTKRVAKKEEPKEEAKEEKKTTTKTLTVTAVEIKVSGDKVADPGQLVELTAEGNALFWDWSAPSTIPENSYRAYTVKVDGKEKSFFVFAHVKPGPYDFVLSGSNETGCKSYRHTVTITGNPDPDPDNPPGPNPPGPVVTPLSRLARDWAREVVSPGKWDEAKSLANAYASVAAMKAAGVIKTQEEIQTVLVSSSRIALGASKDHWLTWATKLQTELDKRDNASKDPLDYVTLFNEVATGLMDFYKEKPAQSLPTKGANPNPSQRTPSGQMPVSSH